MIKSPNHCDVYVLRLGYKRVARYISVSDDMMTLGDDQWFHRAGESHIR